MMTRHGRTLALALALVAGACASSPELEDAPNVSPVAPSETGTPPAVRDILSAGLDMVPVEPGTYFVDADLDPSTPLRVVFDIPAEGWSSWIGAAKFGPNDGHVGVSITTVVNLVGHGCRDHYAADPPVGPTVDDLATALSELAPFEVTSAPEDVTIYGYSGRHLAWTVPDVDFARAAVAGQRDEEAAVLAEREAARVDEARGEHLDRNARLRAGLTNLGRLVGRHDRVGSPGVRARAIHDRVIGQHRVSGEPEPPDSRARRGRARTPGCVLAAVPGGAGQPFEAVSAVLTRATRPDDDA